MSTRIIQRNDDEAISTKYVFACGDQFADYNLEKPLLHEEGCFCLFEAEESDKKINAKTGRAVVECPHCHKEINWNLHRFTFVSEKHQDEMY
mgnify:CR=1 FL=1